MSKLNSAISAYGVSGLLDTQHLEPLYNAELLRPDISDSERLELRGQAVYYPVVVSKNLYGEDREDSSYIPIGDHEAKAGGTYMGMLVAASTLETDLFVIKHFPQPVDTPLPTRILTTFGGNVTYPPIRGFLLHAKSRKDIALIVGDDEKNLEARTFGFMKGRHTVANLVMHGVKSAIHKHAKLNVRNS